MGVGGGGGVISDNSKDNKTMLGGFSDASLMPAQANQPRDDLTFANNNSSLIGGKGDEVGMNLKLQ